MNKARRGELRCRLPVGLIYDAADRVVLDPDQQVQDAIRLFFKAFERTGSACATVKEFSQQGLTFPRRVMHGANKGQILWGELEHARALWVLHHPRYAGAFCYGRSRQSKIGKTHYKKLPRDQWIALLRDAHPGYISWEQYEANLEQLRQNAAAYGTDRRKGPPREGAALLQGIVICGCCGKRMTVRYNQRQGEQQPTYICQSEGIKRGNNPCTVISGTSIDQAIGELVLEQLTPLTLEVALKVQEQLQSRFDQADQQRHKVVERAQYEADLAQRRFLQVAPENRLVADSLEAQWNETLRALTEANEHYQRQRESERLLIDDEQRQQIMALANDFPALWRDVNTPQRERKRMLRLLIEDVTLHKADEIVMHVRFRGGATQTLHLPRPLTAGEARKHKPELIAEIDQLLNGHTDKEIADVLNERGRISFEGGGFHRLMVRNIRLTYHLTSYYDRLRAKGYLTSKEIAAQLGIAKSTVSYWRRKGWLKAVVYNDKQEHLYVAPDDNTPRKSVWKSRNYEKVIPQEP